MGTRFYASLEAEGHPEAKQRIVAAQGGQTVRSIVFDLSRRNRWPAPYTGRVLRNLYLLQVKKPEESRSKWDIYNVVATVPGEEAFRPLDQGNCPLVEQAKKQ